MTPREAASRIVNAVTRAKLTLAAYAAGGTRTLVQVGGLSNETLGKIELLLPYGYSAMPVGATADFIVLQVNGQRDHKVALAGDDPALRISDLVAGEFGLRDPNGQQIVFRTDHLEITTPLAVTVTSTGNVTVNAPEVTVPSGDVLASGISLKNHVHTGVTAGGANTGGPTG